MYIVHMVQKIIRSYTYVNVAVSCTLQTATYVLMLRSVISGTNVCLSHAGFPIQD